MHWKIAYMLEYCYIQTCLFCHKAARVILTELVHEQKVEFKSTRLYRVVYNDIVL